MDFSKNHGLWMALGCLIPILLLFALPALGIEGDWIPLLFIVTMLLCHLMMMGGHGKHQADSAAASNKGHPEADSAAASNKGHPDSGTGRGGERACH